MPPQRPRAAIDDSRSETSSTKEKQALTAPSGVSKGRRVASSNLASIANAPARSDALTKATANGAAPAASNPATPDVTPGINWADQPLSLLHSYRHAYRLQIPSAFSHPNSHILLSHGIGRYSPTTIASRRAKRRLRHLQSQNQNAGQQHAEREDSTGRGANGFAGGKIPKEQLAMAVRKHFNAMGLNESETIVRFEYVARESSREFRQRFRP